MTETTSPSAPRLYVFETTNAAMWAEDVALEKGIPAEVVPAPPEAEAKCGLALRTRTEHAEALETAMTDEGITFRPVD